MGNRQSPHDAHEGARQLRLCARPSYPSSPRQCRRWLLDLEEDHEFRRRRLLLVRAHAHEGQLHEGDVRGLEGDVRILDPRLVETNPLQQAPFQEFTDYLAATKAVPT